MANKTFTLILVAVGLALGNLAFQYFSQAPNYSIAIERTWFQIVAVLATAFVINP